MRHYVDVTDADFERATRDTEIDEPKAAQNEAQQAHVEHRNVSHDTNSENKKIPVLQCSVSSCETGDGGNRTRIELFGTEFLTWNHAELLTLAILAR
jgi:hypothetical protein